MSTKGSLPDLPAALMVLSQVSGEAVPVGPLNASSVPWKALEAPVLIAMSELKEHAMRCKNLSCAHVPPNLRVYRRMRPSALMKFPNEIHKALWEYPHHELVEWVRTQVRKANPELASDLMDGSILETERLESLIGGGPADVREITAMAWATDFEGPESESLFRYLTPLTVDHIAEELTPRPQIPEGDSRKLRQIRKQLRAAERQCADLKKGIGSKDRELAQLRRENQELVEGLEEVDKTLSKTKQQVSDREYHLSRSVKEVETLTRASTNVRKDLREAARRIRDLEIARSDYARKLASAHGDNERLILEKKAMPTGKEAMWLFIQDEEERIQMARNILSGGDRLRANDEWTRHKRLETAFLDAYPEFRTPRPVKIRPKTPLKFTILGGGAEIGKSCYLLEFGERRILVDCGIKPGSRVHNPDLSRLDRLDAVVLTHAHTDHVGWIPALLNRFPDEGLQIYCSEGTAGLLDIVLQDCRQHYIRRQKGIREIANRIANADPVIDDYEDADVQEASFRLITCPFNEPEVLPFGGITLEFFEAGHILGAASVLIEDESGRRAFMSGDFASFDQLTVPRARWPQDLGDIDLLVLESTYGGRNHFAELEEVHNDLLGFLTHRIENDRGSTILASFGIGRAQELLLMLDMGIKEGRMPEVPVFIDGMIKRINPIYERLTEFRVPDGFENVIGETGRQEAIHVSKQRPSIVVTTSGMLNGGPVVEYARNLLPDGRHQIVLSGYQDEGAPSRALRDIEKPSGRRIVTIEDEEGKRVEFQAANAAYEAKFSAHADQKGLIEYANRMSAVNICLVHGNPEAQNELGHLLKAANGHSKIHRAPPTLSVP